jgi:hypothetical protein
LVESSRSGGIGRGFRELRGSNSVGRVTAFQAVGRGFESRLPLEVIDRTFLGGAVG